MSSSESYEDENIFLSADEEENQSQHFNSDEEEIEEISASFYGLQPYQFEPEREFVLIFLKMLLQIFALPKVTRYYY